MDKKDIYEHLAHIYLDASSKRKKKAKPRYKTRKMLFINTAAISLVGLLTLFIYQKDRPATTVSPVIASELALILQPDIVKINFHFEPAKKEVYAINLNELDLRRFKTLGFSLRKANFDDKITLKVEFANAFRENSQIYINDIKSYKWQEYRIPFSDFKNINSWSKICGLSFIIDELNVKTKKGIVYLDDVKLLR